MSELKPISQFDFSGGENTAISPYLLPKNQIQQINNMVLNEHGSLKTRDGTLITTFYNNTGVQNLSLSRFFIYNSMTGGSFNVQIAVTDLISSAYRLYNTSTSPWTLIGTMSSSFAPSVFWPIDVVYMNNLAIISNGYVGVPNSYNGATLAALTDTGGASNLIPQLAAFIANFNSSLYLLNTNNQTATYSAHGASVGVGSSSIQPSDVLNPNSWPVAYQFYLDKDNNQQITGCGQFTIAESGIAPSQFLVVFKNNSTYEITGTLSSPTVTKLKTDMGCIAHRSIQFVSGFGMIRLTHKGFAVFDGLDDTVISEAIGPRLFGLNGFPGVDWFNALHSESAQISNPPAYICACPQVGDPELKLSIIFMYDLIRKAWSVHTLANPVMSLSMVTFPSGYKPQSKITIVAGDYVGFSSSLYAQARRLFSGDTTDDGTAIAWSATLRPVFASSPVDRNYFRRALAIVNVPGTPTSITGQFFYGATSKSVSKTPPTRTQDSVIPFDLGFIANNTYPTISGTGPVTIRGLEYHAKPKPPTRSTILVGDP